MSEVSELVAMFGDHQQEVTDFVAAYANLCQQFGGAEEVRSVQQEIKFRNAQGADMVEALAESYSHFRRKYGLE